MSSSSSGSLTSASDEEGQSYELPSLSASAMGSPSDATHTQHSTSSSSYPSLVQGLRNKPYKGVAGSRTKLGASFSKEQA